ncbi:MAG: hypothetical protein LUE98_11440 [Tannerellaceae bacterium]|nr:hypothetical protein [Tannerellaceae bacterium]
MTKSELKKLSEETFFDNSKGGITPEAHREFNNSLIDSMQLIGEIEQNWIKCEFVDSHYSNMYWSVNGNSLILNGYVECSNENPILSIYNIPNEYINRIKKNFSVQAEVEINGDHSSCVASIGVNNNTLNISLGYMECYSNRTINLIFANLIFDVENKTLSWAAGNIEGNFRDITYGAGKFVTAGGAMTTYAKYAISIDGVNWTIGDIGFGFSSIIYGNSKFVAVCSTGNDTGKYGISIDGINWTIGDIGTNLSSIVYGNGRFVAIGVSGNTKCGVSNDGINWTQGTIGSPYYAITYGNGKFIAVSSSHTQYSISTDGINWVTGNIGVALNSIAYGNGKFVGISRNGGYAISTDGISWNTGNIGVVQLNTITYGNGKFVAVGNDNYAILTV